MPEKSWYEKLEIRPYFNSRIDFKASQILLDKLCIVTGASADYWYLLLSNIESVRNCPEFNNVAICVIDLGLSQEQRQILQAKYNVKHFYILDRWLVPFEHYQHFSPRFTPRYIKRPARFAKDGYKVIMCKPFLDKLFPDFEYYLWLDSDTWVQDAYALHYLADSVSKQPAIAIGEEKGRLSQYLNKYYGALCSIYQKERVDTFYDKHYMASGVFACQKSFFEAWRADYSANVAQYGFAWNMEELSFNYLFYAHGFTNCAPYLFNYTEHYEGLPIPKGHHLYTMHSNQPIGIMHIDREKSSIFGVQSEISSDLRYLKEKYPDQKLFSRYFRTLPHYEKIENLKEEGTCHALHTSGM